MVLSDCRCFVFFMRLGYKVPVAFLFTWRKDFTHNVLSQQNDCIVTSFFPKNDKWNIEMMIKIIC